MEALDILGCDGVSFELQAELTRHDGQKWVSGVKWVPRAANQYDTSAGMVLHPSQYNHGERSIRYIL